MILLWFMVTSVPLGLRNAYLATELFVAVDGIWLDGADAVRELGGSLFVITAWNPFSRRLERQENEQRNADLLTELRATGLTVHHALGRDPRGAWQEEGFAVVGLGRRAARRFGRAYGQHAVFEVTETELRVVGCEGQWSEARPISEHGWQPPLESGATLAEVIHSTLGIRVAAEFLRARERGWVHDDGVGLACPDCPGELELFGCELTSKSGVPYRSLMFVCPAEGKVLLPNRVTAGSRAAAKSRRAFLLARADANALGLTERGYWCYCIELDGALGEHPDGRPWIYVGQSSRTPEERFAQHRAGYKASKWVRRHGVRLRPDLYAGQPVLRTEAEARAYERWRYDTLDAAGWPVKGGT